MSESTSWPPGVAPAYYNDEYYLSAPVAAAAAYNEEYLGAPGVRFVPTDQELIVDYLGRKLRGEPLPTDMVHEGHNAYAEHPKKLVPNLGEDIEGSWYLFSERKRKYPSGMRPERAMRNEEGHWKATGAEKPVLGGRDGKEVIGTRRALTFHEDTYETGRNGRRRRVKNKAAASKPSKWKMVEFVYSNSCRRPGEDAAPDKMVLNNWVLCKITNRSQGVEGEEDEEEQPAPDGGGGEPYERHIPDQEQAAGGGTGGTQEGQQQQGPSGAGGGAASDGNQQPAAADCGLDLGDTSNVDEFSWFSNDYSMSTSSIFDWYDPPGLLLP